MDSDTKTSNFERRSSTRHSLRLSTANANTNGTNDDDDYDLSAMMVADGFRPTENTTTVPVAHSSQSYPNEVSPSTPTSETPEPQLNVTPQQVAPSKGSPDQVPGIRNRPTSISKPPRSHDSLALRNDGTSAGPMMGGTQLPRSSMSSDAPVMRVESPYTGPSGPSHPYQMYPQRTMSVATTSTTVVAGAAAIPEDRSYNGPRGPTHPYAMYPQNTASEEEPSEQAIPVGFNNMGGSYQRQIGPDGEEAGDMIGPLGHMEELPPYTRYPENAFASKATPIGASITTASDTNQNISADTTPDTTEPTSPEVDRTIAGAGGIGMATRDPEFSSTEDDLVMPRTRPSVRSNRSEMSQHDVNTAARDLAEKPRMTKWQRRAKKKLWGIVPYWAICLLTVGLVIMGIVMGAVIGTLLSRHKKPPQSDSSQAQTSDVSHLSSVPNDLSPISTGHFGLPPFKVSQQSNQCVNDSTRTTAWSCDMPFSYYSMDVTPNDNSSAPPVSGYQLVMAAINATDAEFIWGTQAPSILEPATLTLVYDNYEPNYGPAWWTQFVYNKTVIVSESDFASLSTRGWDDDDDDDAPFPPPTQFKKKSAGAKEGDKPWICKWPDVRLEIFIYPKRNTSASASTTTSSASASSTSSSSSNSAPPSYPKVLKMVELRYVYDKSQLAYCSHVQIVDGGKSFIPVKDSDGNPEEVTILENDYSWSQKFSNSQRFRQVPRRWLARDILAKRGNVELTNCGCVWWST